MNIDQKIKDAMLSKDSVRLSVLRGLKSALTNLASKSAGGISSALTDAQVASVVRNQIKQRNDSIEMFNKGGRQDLADKESSELIVLKEFLPQELSASELGSIIHSAIESVKPTSMKDMGKVIGAASKLANGRIDGKILSEKISEILKNTL